MNTSNHSTETAHELPVSGPLPRPKSMSEAAQVLKQERIAVGFVSSCEFNCDEFTSVCPRTGQPDFGRVFIRYVPNQYGLESKALKYYLWAFRDEGVFCEGLAKRIADDVFEAIEPEFLSVTVEQFRRGGIGLTVTAERQGRNRTEK